ncbi:MAG: hypothetical protein QM757_11520 [Paludibaculum sp.]
MQALAEKYDLPYTTGSLPVQYLKAWRTIAKLSLPDRFLLATADDAPETASERRFKAAESAQRLVATVDPVTGRRRGLRTAIVELRRRRRGRKAALQLSAVASGDGSGESNAA